MGSRKKEPVSDDLNPHAHAPRPDFRSLTVWEIMSMCRQWWEPVKLQRMYLCRVCSHATYNHMRGYCSDCKHDCEGTEALHEELRPLWEQMIKVYQSRAKERLHGPR